MIFCFISSLNYDASLQANSNTIPNSSVAAVMNNSFHKYNVKTLGTGSYGSTLAHKTTISTNTDDIVPSVKTNAYFSDQGTVVHSSFSNKGVMLTSSAVSIKKVTAFQSIKKHSVTNKHSPELIRSYVSSVLTTCPSSASMPKSGLHNEPLDIKQTTQLITEKYFNLPIISQTLTIPELTPSLALGEMHARNSPTTARRDIFEPTPSTNRRSRKSMLALVGKQKHHNTKLVLLGSDRIGEDSSGMLSWRAKIPISSYYIIQPQQGETTPWFRATGNKILTVSSDILPKWTRIRSSSLKTDKSIAISRSCVLYLPITKSSSDDYTERMMFTQNIFDTEMQEFINSISLLSPMTKSHSLKTTLQSSFSTIVKTFIYHKAKSVQKSQYIIESALAERYTSWQTDTETSTEDKFLSSPVASSDQEGGDETVKSFSQAKYASSQLMLDYAGKQVQSVNTNDYFERGDEDIFQPKS